MARANLSGAKDCGAGWPGDWLAGWPAGWLAGWLARQLAGLAARFFVKVAQMLEDVRRLSQAPCLPASGSRNQNWPLSHRLNRCLATATVAVDLVDGRQVCVCVVGGVGEWADRRVGEKLPLCGFDLVDGFPRQLWPSTRPMA